jgi:hypothetical protein
MEMILSAVCLQIFYGPHDNYDLNNSHVLPAMLRKFHEAKSNKKGNLLSYGGQEVLFENFYMWMTWQMPAFSYWRNIVD